MTSTALLTDGTRWVLVELEADVEFERKHPRGPGGEWIKKLPDGKLAEIFTGTFGKPGQELEARVDVAGGGVFRVGGKGSNTYQVSGYILDPKTGQGVGTFERFVRLDRHEAHNAGMAIEPEFQGRGFASAFNKHVFDELRKLGVKKVTVIAGRDAGGRAWARVFDFDVDAIRAGGWMDGAKDEPEPELRRNFLQRLVSEAILEGRVAAEKGQAMVERIKNLDWAAPAQLIGMDGGDEALAGARWPGVRSL